MSLTLTFRGRFWFVLGQLCLFAHERTGLETFLRWGLRATSLSMSAIVRESQKFVREDLRLRTAAIAADYAERIERAAQLIAEGIAAQARGDGAEEASALLEKIDALGLTSAQLDRARLLAQLRRDP